MYNPVSSVTLHSEGKVAYLTRSLSLLLANLTSLSCCVSSALTMSMMLSINQIWKVSRLNSLFSVTWMILLTKYRTSVNSTHYCPRTDDRTNEIWNVSRLTLIILRNMNNRINQIRNVSKLCLLSFLTLTIVPNKYGNCLLFLYM